MIVAILAFVLSTRVDSPRGSESVDMIELNHYHDCLGRHVYDQVIFWDWSPVDREFEVRAWVMVDSSRLDAKLPKKDYSSGRHVVAWYDVEQRMHRRLSSDVFRESWTQRDPERDNQRALPDRLRTALVKRRVEAKPEPLDVVEPIEPSGDSGDSGEMAEGKR